MQPDGFARCVFVRATLLLLYISELASGPVWRWEFIAIVKALLK
jgi:hypothetical protein